jgi:hypothetical protein
VERAVPAVKGKRHGGTNPGAPKGNRNAWKHWAYSAKAKAAAAFLKQIAKVIESADNVMNWV